MKKVLVIGAAGSLGIQTVKFLLSEGKYELTLLDLKNKSVFNKLKKYKKRANVLFGDVSDRTLMEALVKDQDFIIYLATALPPLANMKSGLAEAIDYGGVENVARALTYYNPKCHLFYASSTSVYKTLVNPSVKTKLELDKYDYFDDYDYDYDYTYNTRKYTNNYDRYNKYNNYNFNKRKYNNTNERIYDIDDMYDVFN